jgi:hypothetical protein
VRGTGTIGAQSSADLLSKLGPLWLIRLPADSPGIRRITGTDNFSLRMVSRQPYFRVDQLDRNRKIVRNVSMNPKRGLIAILLIGTIVLTWADADDSKKAGIPKELLGSWEQVIAQKGNQITRPDAADKDMVKSLHITATHFNRVAYNAKTKQLFGVVGGHAKISDGRYVETIEFADEASRKAAEGQNPVEFTFDVKDDVLTLKLEGYTEVWKRAK